MDHFREAKPGKYWLNAADRLPDVPSEIPAFLRFAALEQGISLDLWCGEGMTAAALLRSANLDWPVDARPVLIPNRRSVEVPAHRYHALVRPDTEDIMSIVTSGYSVAENEWVALALEQLSSRFGEYEPLIAGTSFGRQAERTLFAGRVAHTEDEALCLLAYNSHGGEGAIHFQLVEVNRSGGVVCVRDSPHASLSISHVGRVWDRLMAASAPEQEQTFIERYRAEGKTLWDRLAATSWTQNYTVGLIEALWGKAPPRKENPAKSTLLRTPDASYRHPAYHLTYEMNQANDAGGAYRLVCDWIDNKSEACERGDFTKNRDERLALGAGNKYKRSAWRWILNNT